MADPQVVKAEKRERRKRRSRKKLFGTETRPRLVVYKSRCHIYAQLIDDRNSRCITGASTLAKELAGLDGSLKEKAARVGELIAKRALERGIDTIVFDRSGYLYHGRVRALAEGARKAGLKF